MKMVFKGIGAIVFGVAALILMQGKNVKAGDPGPTATPTATPTPIAVSVGEGNLPELEETPEMKEHREFFRMVDSLYAGEYQGFGGIWLDNGIYVIGVTEAFDRDKFTKECSYPYYRLETVKYTYEKLRNAYSEICTNRESDSETADVAMYIRCSEQENCILVNINANSDEKQRGILKEKLAKYADLVQITEHPWTNSNDIDLADYLVEFSLDKGSKEVNTIGVSMPQRFFEAKHPISPAKETAKAGHFTRNLMIASVCVLLIVLTVVFVCAFSRRRIPVRVSGSGQQLTDGAAQRYGEIEALVKRTQEDVSDEARDRIFAAYEKECGEKQPHME